jgi:glucuronate isomerase
MGKCGENVGKMWGKWNMGSDAKAETKPGLDLGAAHYVDVFMEHVGKFRGNPAILRVNVKVSRRFSIKRIH